jgi:hypothetical protein
MKQFFLVLVGFVSSFIAFAQPTASEGSTDFQRTTQPAAIIELPYSEKVVEKAIKEYMSKKGYKDDDSKGFKIFRGYKIKNSHDYNSDLYFKIERKGRREKEATVIFLIAGKTGEDIKKRVVNDNSSIDGAKDLLEDMIPAIVAADLEVQILDQEDVIKKADKKYNGLIDDQNDYEKRIKGLEDKLVENKKDQEKQKEEVKKQREILQALRDKRKS